MKKDIHPTYYPNAKITCACGAEFNVGSTEEKIHVEVCSMCHPFYTGKEKLMDTAGRVDKFRQRMAAAEQHKTAELKNKKTKELKKETTEEKSTEDKNSYFDIIKPAT